MVDMVPAQDVRRPNIILLVLDAVRADHLSCYGYERLTTPNLELVATESILYEKCIAPANWSVPSHASLFTGMYPSAHNTNFRNLELPAELPTLAEILRFSGYQTCAITSNAWISEATGLHRGFDEYYPMFSSRRSRNQLMKFKMLVDKAWRQLLGLNDKGGRRSLKLFRRWLFQRGLNRPFFLFINLLDAHAPYGVPRGAKGRQFTAGRSIPRRWRRPYLGADYIANNDMLDAGDLALLSDLYDGGVCYVDDLTRQLVDSLMDAGLYEESLFIVTSDHGESLGEDGVLGHQFKLTEDLLHVPLLMKLPGKQYGAVRVAESVQLVDLMPTILEVAQISHAHASANMEGFPILPDRIGDLGREYVIAEDIGPEVGVLRRRHGEDVASRWDLDQWMVASGQWAYTEYENKSYQIRGDVSDDEIDAARRHLFAWRRRPAAVKHGNAVKEATGSDNLDNEMHPDLLKRLRDQGYIE